MLIYRSIIYFAPLLISDNH